MNYKKAMAEVCAKYRNPRTRTSAAALLERYASATRPVTAWHAVGEDADAARLLLETLGFREKEHFTVQTSVLDPKAFRFSWTAAGLKLVMAMPDGLAGTDFAEMQRRILAPGAREDPLEPLPTPIAGGDVGAALDAGPSFGDRVLEKTLEIARRVKAAMACEEAVFKSDRSGFADRWADRQLDQQTDRKLPMPVAPLGVLEALARMEGAEGLPEVQIFDLDADYATAGCAGWQGSRIVAAGEAVPSGRINAMPLNEQKMPGGPLDGYLAWTRDDWARFDGNRGRTAWTQFDAAILPSAEALNFALDAEAMRRFVLAILEHGYGPGFRYALSWTTRLAVGNLAAPEVHDENTENEDGGTSSFGYRIEESVMPYRNPVYMGAHLMTELETTAEATSRWGAVTGPVRIATAGQSEAEAEAEGGDAGLKAAEAAEEWFMLVHGAATWPTSTIHPRTANERKAKLVRMNLARFRADAQTLRRSPQAILTLCSPGNPRFIATSCDLYTPEGAFVNGLCAAMRKFSGGNLEFVSGTPYFPDNIVAGVWSGLSTDLGPETPEEARDADAFPRVVSYAFADGAAAYAGQSTAAASAFIDLMRENPSVQLRFGKRTKGMHRSHVIVLETNVKAKPFLESLSREHSCWEFVCAGWRAFYTSFLMRLAAPLASVDTSFGTYGRTGVGLTGFVDLARYCVPEWAAQVETDASFTRSVPLGFDFGWLADEYGRLLLVIQTKAANLALRAKLAFRYVEELPLPTAAYLAAHGRSNSVVLAGLVAGQRYAALLRAAVAQTGFDKGVAPGVTCGARGQFGYIWYSDLLTDMDSDEAPPRSWYLDGDASVEAVRMYVRDSNPF